MSTLAEEIGRFANQEVFNRRTDEAASLPEAWNELGEAILKRIDDQEHEEPDGMDVWDMAVGVLNECVAVLAERGKQYGNASLEEPGLLTGRPASDLLLALLEVKLNRFRNDIRAHRPLKRDTVVDLCNYAAFTYARYEIDFAEENKP